MPGDFALWDNPFRKFNRTPVKRNLRKLFDPFHKQIAMEWLIKISKRKILLPLYHTISESRLPHISNLYSVRNIELFYEDIEFLCKYYEPVSIDDLFEIVSNRKKTGKPIFHLTFDDGLREFYTIVAPILEEKGIPATVFLNSDFIDNRDMFYRYKVSLIIEFINSSDETWWHGDLSSIFGLQFANIQQIKQRLLSLTYKEKALIDPIAKLADINFSDFLTEFQPYLNSGDITDLINRGFTIGSHSSDHPLFNELTISEQKNQVSNSFEYLETKFNLTNKYYSFPFNDEGVEAQLFNWLYNEENCRLSFGISGLKDDISKYHLHRVPMEGVNDPADKLIKSEYLYFLLKAIVNKNKIMKR